MQKTSKAKQQHHLDDLIREWQQRLRLEDWDIEAELVPMADIRAYGIAKTALSVKTATLQLGDPTHAPTGLTCSDFEVTIVHELLHVKAAEALEIEYGTDASEPHPINRSAHWECFVEHLAQALVAAKRNRRRIR